MEDINHFNWFCRLMREDCDDFKKKLSTLSKPSRAKLAQGTNGLSPGIPLSTTTTDWREDQGTRVHQMLSAPYTLSVNTINAAVIVRLRAKCHTHAKRVPRNYWKLKNHLRL